MVDGVELLSLSNQVNAHLGAAQDMLATATAKKLELMFPSLSRSLAESEASMNGDLDDIVGLKEVGPADLFECGRDPFVRGLIPTSHSEFVYSCCAYCSTVHCSIVTFYLTQ